MRLLPQSTNFTLFVAEGTYEVFTKSMKITRAYQLVLLTMRAGLFSFNKVFEPLRMVNEVSWAPSLDVPERIHTYYQENTGYKDRLSEDHYSISTLP